MPSPLLLVDALGIAYRAYYAIAGLATAAGKPTNAVYGFIKTLMQLERIWRPSHCLVVFDGGLPAERIEMLATYKAQRPAMPAALREQLPLLDDYLDRAGICRIRMEGQEADDVMASIATMSAADGMEVLLASADKDMLQIVSQNISAIAPGHAETKITPDQVQAKTGVRPEQIVDWLAMIGDAADNIPGAPGIGPKTAARLLQDWGGLAAIFAGLERVEPEKIRRTLDDNRALLELNQRMLRLKTDLACGLKLTDLAVKPADNAGLLAFFEAMEFYSLAKSLREPSFL